MQIVQCGEFFCQIILSSNDKIVGNKILVIMSAKIAPGLGGPN